MNEKTNFNYTNLSPFKWFVLENFPFIEADFDALTEWQLYSKIGKEINKIIDSQNIVGEQAETLTNAFNNLQNYVNNYFDNLDLQEEVNNKLNEMVEDGTLENIINNEIFNDLNNKVNNNTNNINLLKNKTNGFELNMQNFSIHDIGNSGRIQGICVDTNNNAYVYNETNFPYGDLLIYNIVSNSFVTKIKNLKLYHGNDLTFLNNKLYITSTKDENGNLTNKTICIYDLATNTLTEVNPFLNINDYQDIWGISSYDENHVLCALAKADEVFSNIGLYLLNINDLSYTKINITNTNNYFVDFYTYHQTMEYINNKIYIGVSAPNTIIELSLINNVANVDKFYQIDNFDKLGQCFGEFQGLTKIPSNIYGKETLMINSEISINRHYNFKTLKTYLINLNSNLPLLSKAHWYEQENVANERTFVYLNNTVNQNLLYEDGTKRYPFKELGRAINCIEYSKIATFTIIKAVGQDYILGYQTRKKFTIEPLNANNFSIKKTPIELIGCEIFINNNFGAENRIKINYEYINIDNSIFKCHYTEFEGDGEITGIKNSIIFLYGAKVITNTKYPINVTTGCLIFGGVDEFVGTSSKKFRIAGFSTLILTTSNNSQDIIEKTGSSTVIKPSWLGY